MIYIKALCFWKAWFRCGEWGPEMGAVNSSACRSQASKKNEGGLEGCNLSMQTLYFRTSKCRKISFLPRRHMFFSVLLQTHGPLEPAFAGPLLIGIR